MPHRRIDSELGVDSDGCLTELTEVAGQPVMIHYDDVPDSDISEVVRNCLRRGLFTREQAIDRLAQPDMASRRGAEVLRRHLALSRH